MEAILAMLAPKMIELLYTTASSWIEKLVGDAGNTLTPNDGAFLNQFIGQRGAELLELTIYKGIDALFEELRIEAENTDNELDDLKIKAIESAARAALQIVFGKRG